MTKQFLVLALLLATSNGTWVRADEKEDKAVKAIEKLGAVITRGPNGQIESIDFRGTPVADADLKNLKDISGLQTIYLGRTKITDAGLEHLKAVKSLTFIGLLQTQITLEGGMALQKALPDCRIASPQLGLGGNRPGRGRVPNPPEVDDKPPALPNQFEAILIKVSNHKIAFSPTGQRTARGSLTRTMPIARDFKLFASASESGLKTGERGVELARGLQDERLQAAFASAIPMLAAKITLNKPGTEITILQVFLPEMLPALAPLPLHPPKNSSGAADSDPLPAHAIARFGSTRFRHTLSNFMSECAFAVAPDGKFIAACNSDSLIVWNAQTGEKAAQIELDDKGIANPIKIVGPQELAISADGTRLAVARGTGRVRILTDMARNTKEIAFGNYANGARVMLGNSFEPPGEDRQNARRFRMGDESPSCSLIAFVPDNGHVLVNQFSSPLLRLMNVETGKVIRTFGSNEQAPNAIAASPDGRWLALAEGAAGKVRVLEIATGKEHLQLTEPSGPCTAIAFSADNTRLVTGSFAVHLWDASSGKHILDMEPSGISANVPNANSFAKPRLRERRQDSIKRLQFSPDGKQVLGGFPASIVLWDSSTGKKTLSSQQPDAVSIRLMPDGKTLLAPAMKTFGFLDPATGKPVRTYEGHRSEITAVALTPDGKQLATAGSNESVCLWNTSSSKVVLESDQGPLGPVRGLSFSPRGDALAASIENCLVVWDAKSGAQRYRKSKFLRRGDPAFTNLTISTDGARVGYGTPFGWACVANFADGEDVELLSIVDWSVGALGMSPDLGLVAASVAHERPDPATPSRIQFWELPTGKELKQSLTVASSPTQLVFSPDGRTLIQGTGILTRQGTFVPATEIATGLERFTMPPADSGSIRGQIGAVAFSADGRRLAVAESFRPLLQEFYQAPKEHPPYSILVMDLPSGRCSPRLIGHEATINALSFSADGSRLASGSSDTTALLWDVAGLFPAPVAEKLSAAERELCWTDLSGEAKKAYRSMWKLAGDSGTVDFLRGSLKTATAQATDAKHSIQGLRAIEVLEWIKTNAAQELLTTLASGEASASLTQEAKRSLQRLQTAVGGQAD